MIAAFAVVLAVIALVVTYTLTASDSQQFDAEDSSMDYSASPQIQKFAKAISVAEGFGLHGAIPTNANNPGDLVIPGWTGATLGSENISVLDFDTIDNPVAPNGGWYRLFHQLNLIAEGRSHVYTLDMSISDMAKKWTATEPEAWALNVANYLGVDPETSLRDLLT